MRELTCWMTGFYIVLAAVFVLVFAPSAHAETHAEKVFGKWEKVATPQQVVPEYVYSSAPLGAVTNQYRRRLVVDERLTLAAAGRTAARTDAALLFPRPAAPEQVAGLNPSLERR